MSSAWKDETSKDAPSDFMMSSSIAPDVVTRMFGILSLQSCAKNPLRPEVTMLEVKVRKTFVFERFIFRMTFDASDTDTSDIGTSWVTVGNLAIADNLQAIVARVEITINSGGTTDLWLRILFAGEYKG